MLEFISLIAISIQACLVMWLVDSLDVFHFCTRLYWKWNFWSNSLLCVRIKIVVFAEQQHGFIRVSKLYLHSRPKSSVWLTIQVGKIGGKLSLALAHLPLHQNGQLHYLYVQVSSSPAQLGPEQLELYFTLPNDITFFVFEEQLSFKE